MWTGFVQDEQGCDAYHWHMPVIAVEQSRQGLSRDWESSLRMVKCRQQNIYRQHNREPTSNLLTDVLRSYHHAGTNRVWLIAGATPLTWYEATISTILKWTGFVRFGWEISLHLPLLSEQGLVDHWHNTTNMVRKLQWHNIVMNRVCRTWFGFIA
jgi:hypothetical protein